MDNHVKNKKIREFRLYIYSLTGKCAIQKYKKLCSSSLWTCLHHMVILRNQNKITNFLMILSWVWAFNKETTQWIYIVLIQGEMAEGKDAPHNRNV